MNKKQTVIIFNYVNYYYTDHSLGLQHYTDHSLDLQHYTDHSLGLQQPYTTPKETLDIPKIKLQRPAISTKWLFQNDLKHNESYYKI
jgi:hypothetical protein